MFHAVVKRALVAAAVLLFAATGCGGVENEPSLAKAVERTEATGSFRIELRATVKEGGSTLDYRCEGAADHERKRLRFSCDPETYDVVAIGDTTYLTSDVFGVSTDKPWVKFPLDEADSVGNYSPEKLLGMLRAASLETARIGEEAVRQVTTVRYRLTVNCEEAQMGCPGTTSADVWIDDDGLVRRIELEDDGNKGTIEFFDFGVTVDIEPPPPDQVADLGAALGSGCQAGDARPISESRALEALRRHGLSVESDTQGCFGMVAAVFENKSADFDRQGYVSCFLYTEQRDNAPKTVDRGGTDGGDARLALANLVCTILADSPRAEEKIRPLEQAFEELERAIRP